MTLKIFVVLFFLSIRGHSITTSTRYGGGGQKMAVFVQAQGIKTFPLRGGGGIWGRGSKNGRQIFLHVGVECPLIRKDFRALGLGQPVKLESVYPYVTYE